MHSFRFIECDIFVHAAPFSFQGYSNGGASFRLHSFLFFPPVPSAQTSAAYLPLNSLINLGSHSSLAMPRSLQHRMSALDLAPSEAVAMPLGSKYSCSPRAVDTKRPRQTRIHSRETILGPTLVSPRGARPHPPGPKALFRIRRYLISGR